MEHCHCPSSLKRTHALEVLFHSSNTSDCSSDMLLRTTLQHPGLWKAATAERGGAVHWRCGAETQIGGLCLFILLPSCLPSCLPACLSACLPVCLSVCRPDSLAACLYVCVSVSLAVCMSVCVSICLRTCLCVCACLLSLCHLVCLSVCLPVCLSVCISTAHQRQSGI